jgi:hypothetical protein
VGAATKHSDARILAAHLCALALSIAGHSPSSYAADDRAWPILKETISTDTAYGRLSLPSQIRLSDARHGERSKLEITLKIDLSALQANASSLLPQDNCRSFSANNVTAKIETSTLVVENGKLKLNVKGDASVWLCTQNPVPNSKVVWEEKNVGLGIKTRIPVVQTWPGTPIKSVLAVQSYTMSNTFSFQPIQNGAVSVESTTDVRATPTEVSALKGIVPETLQGSEKSAKSLLQNISSVESARKILPAEFRDVNLVVISAAFATSDSRPSAILVYSADVSGAQVDVLKQRAQAQADAHGH